jgi:hypothetical protein
MCEQVEFRALGAQIGLDGGVGNLFDLALPGRPVSSFIGSNRLSRARTAGARK